MYAECSNSGAGEAVDFRETSLTPEVGSWCGQLGIASTIVHVYKVVIFIAIIENIV